MSVKTGGSGENPAIAMMMNATCARLEEYAATAMAAKIIKGAKPDIGKSKSMEHMVSRFTAPILLHAEAEKTQSEAKRKALVRHDIEKGKEQEFFDNYASYEEEYLVEGAMLTCTGVCLDTVYLTAEDDGTQSFYEAKEDQENTELTSIPNSSNKNNHGYANVSDCIKGVNINWFGNCKFSNDSGNESKINKQHDECSKHGTCYALMNVCREWDNTVVGVKSDGGGEKKDYIHMLSTLGCYAGGIIHPVDSGQEMSEMEEKLKGNSGEIDYHALAVKYGANEYTTRESLLDAELVELIARTIYGEQTENDNEADLAQEAVAWTIANRVFAQNKSTFSLNNEPSNLFNIIARPSQYTCLEKENGNYQSYTKKEEGDIGWKGWENAVKLSTQLVTFFEENYEEGVALPEEEINKLRGQLESAMCPSPIGDGCMHREKGTFKKHYTTDADETRHYFDEIEIYPPTDWGGNTYFRYIPD